MVCACVGRWTGTARDRDAHAEVGWMDQDAVGFWSLRSPSHGHTCPLRGCRSTATLRRGGRPQIATHVYPPLVRQGRGLVGHCTRCGPRRKYPETHAGREERQAGRRAGRGEGRFWRKGPARIGGCAREGGGEGGTGVLVALIGSGILFVPRKGGVTEGWWTHVFPDYFLVHVRVRRQNTRIGTILTVAREGA